jgi:hypothetical protein
MRQDVLWKPTLPSYDPYMRVHTVIGILRATVMIPAYRAEIIAWDLITGLALALKDTGCHGRWLRELCNVLFYVRDSRRAVPGTRRLSGRVGFAALRTVCLGKQDYLQHVRSSRDRQGKRTEPEILSAIDAHLPQGLYWMTEVTDPDILTGNSAKYGETVFPSWVAVDTSTPSQLSSVRHVVRLPGQVLFSSDREDVYTRRSCRVSGYTPLYTR